MRVLVLGGYGFIGSHITLALHNKGHQVTIAGRDIEYARLKFPFLKMIKIDFTSSLSLSFWTEVLSEFDVVINAIGVLHDKQNVLKRIHAENPKALFNACALKAKKLIHISALGADAAAKTDYASTKEEAELELKQHNFDWIVLRPSLVYAKGTFGGTSLLRGLAALPIIPLVGKGDQLFEPIAMSDLVNIINQIVDNNIYSKSCLDITGPETLSIRNILSLYREWLGLGKATFKFIPVIWCRLFCKLGDYINLPPINSTSLRMMLYGNVSHDKDYQSIFKMNPLSMEKALWLEPSTVQDRWHAKLYFVKVILKIVLSIFWILSGIVPYLNQYQSTQYLSGVLPEGLVAPAFYISTLWDIGLGLDLLLCKRTNWVLLLQLITVVVYTGILSIYMPGLWLDPFGSLLKNIPVMLLILNLYVLSEER